MLIFNATNETQSVKALGNWFTLKPKQIKNFEDKIGNFLATDRKENGLVALPDEFEDSEYRNSIEGKEKLAIYEQNGIDSYLAFHRQIIYNNQVSLRQDLEMANLKVDPAALASEGELNSMKIVASYKRSEADKAQQRIDAVKELMKDVGSVTK